MAVCLQTGLQRIMCNEKHDCGKDVWTGEFPGSADAKRLGWWHRWHLCGWVRCEADHRDARPDLIRLVRAAKWNREKQRWELPDA